MTKIRGDHTGTKNVTAVTPGLKREARGKSTTKGCTTMTKTVQPVLVATAVALASVAVLTATYWRYRSSQSTHKNGSGSTSNNDDTSSSSITITPSHDPQLDAAFTHATTQINQFQDFLSTAEQLLLYALYKQATVGNAPSSEAPPLWQVVAHAKYSAWNQSRNMSCEEAREKYVYATRQIQKRMESGQEDDFDYDEEDDDAPPMAPVQSRPAHVENGGHDDYDDSLVNTNGEASALNALVQAALHDKVDDLPELLHDVDINASDPQTGQTMLHLASDKGSVAVVDYLLRHGAHVTAVDADGISVLQTAVIAGHVEICRRLLVAGADPDQCDHDGDSPRTCAQEDGSEELRALFVDLEEREI